MPTPRGLEVALANMQVELRDVDKPVVVGVVKNGLVSKALRRIVLRRLPYCDRHGRREINALGRTRMYADKRVGQCRFAAVDFADYDDRFALPLGLDFLQGQLCLLYTSDAADE